MTTPTGLAQTVVFPSFTATVGATHVRAATVVNVAVIGSVFEVTLPRVAVTLPAIVQVAAFGAPVNETLDVAAKLVVLGVPAATTQVPVRLDCLTPLQVSVKSPTTL